MQKYLINKFWETIDFMDVNRHTLHNLFNEVDDFMEYEYGDDLGDDRESFRRYLATTLLDKKTSSNRLSNRIYNIKYALDEGLDLNDVWEESFTKEGYNPKLNRVLSDLVGGHINRDDYREDYENLRHMELKSHTYDNYASMNQRKKDMGYSEDTPDWIVKSEIKPTREYSELSPRRKPNTKREFLSNLATEKVIEYTHTKNQLEELSNLSHSSGSEDNDKTYSNGDFGQWLTQE